MIAQTVGGGTSYVPLSAYTMWSAEGAFGCPKR